MAVLGSHHYLRTTSSHPTPLSHHFPKSIPHLLLHFTTMAAAVATPPSTTTATHILIIPYPAQGHMLALLDLTSQLSLHGFKITILVTPKNLPLLTPLLTTHPSIETLVLPFPSHPLIPPGVENIKDLGNHGNPVMITALSGLQTPIINWFNTHPDPPQAIISDFFLGWINHLADKLRNGIPNYRFFSCRAFLICVLNQLFADVGKYKDQEVVKLIDLPYSPELKYSQLPSMFKLCVESNPVTEVVKDGMLANLACSGCIFNSWWELESDYLNHLMIGNNNNKNPVFAVGPISLSLSLTSGGLKRAIPDTNSVTKNEPLFRFLDESQDGSVLYVSFGSQKWLTEQQSNSLATALEKSGARFVWVARSAPGSEPVPEGFESRVAGRGVVVRGWAAQEEILGHKAVGGFLSHCGWNSVMEAVVAGVMILAWPMEADQFLNARLVVEEIGFGVLVCEGADAVPEVCEMGRVIREAMKGSEVVEKRKAMELKRKAFEVVGEGGSSAKGLEELVQVLRGIALQEEK